jgi:O-acetyl-ADP-ribose deacetylase (regulator of RNase III)
MSIEYIIGDITQETSGLIIHGCNCKGVMGAGIALAIRNKWPKVFKEYKSYLNKYGDDALGTLQIVKISDGLYIGNAFTQLTYGRNPEVKYADVHAIKLAVHQAVFFAGLYELELKSSAIGSSLGGLDWEQDVLPIYQDLEKKCPEEVIIKIYRLDE